ncbi:EAL domain-containing protein [Marichromatium bheemlicum]|uniref:EAL domain-containing protein n=1 Tax=Marichromatium bheemlicum TaxID=365339 RepID=A0ABX1I4G1_9GAMM|nr:ABC transporter substrate-binding protein [Marichromatium bheemlicum]NKN31981.1 EAL domain-containing protein [Marichromatium bheemlicum]
MSHIAPIRLGLMPPLTGLVSLYGPEISWAGRIACAEINATGGVLGRPLELVIVDDGSQPETAVPAAARLLDEHGCAALIGNLLSNARIAVAGQVSLPRRVPYLNFSFYEGSIHHRYFFNFAALPNQQIEHMIPYMARLAGPKMFFAGNNYEWPHGSIDAAKRALKQCGGEVVGEDYLPFGSLRIDALLNRVARSGADVFVPYFAGVDQIELLTRFTQLGLKSRMTVVMGHFDEAMAARLAPEVREGFYSSNTYFMTLDTATNDRYLRALSALPEVDALHPEGRGVLTNFGEGTYVCVHAFAQAVARAGTVATEAVIEALEAVDLEAPQGRVRMDPATHHAAVNGHLARCGFDGRFEIIESFGLTAPTIPERYCHLLPRPAPATPPDAPTHRRAQVPQVAVAGVDAEDRIEYVNRALLRLWGIADELALLGAPLTRLWADDDPPLAEIHAALREREEWHGVLQARLSDGRRCQMTVTAEPSLGADTNPGYTLACIDPQTVTPHLGASRVSEQMLSMADVAILAITTESVVLEANRRASELFGYRGNEMVGLPVEQLIPPQYRQRHAQLIEHFLNGPEQERRMGMRAEVSGYRKDGSPFPAEVSISKVRGDDDWVLVVTLRDITERKIAEEELEWRASHDVLTGLPNRTLIRERLAHALTRSRNQGHGVGVLLIDLDGFKLINDSHGHATGDALLKANAQRLMNHVRPGDTVARLGGDEFVVLCDRIDHPPMLTALATRINDLLREPLQLDGHQLFATASIGLALGHGTTHNADDLLRNADTAMYAAKEQGRDNARLFSEEIHEQAKRRLDISNGLRQAIERDELTVRFQPILSVDTQRIRGAELLLRWSPNSGEVSPAHFIPIAEMNGAIVPIGKWVFRQACQAEAEWRTRFGAAHAPYISVNVSARQLNDAGLVDDFTAILADTGADPSRILLELTETSLMSDVNFNLGMLRQLAEHGLRVAVDDFGTGYSSLAQLLRLPVSTLKIDREFVDGLDKRNDSRAIVSAVCSMARAMDLGVIAEGVENTHQLDYLRDIGCHYVQGYHFYRPLPAETLSALLETSAPAPATPLAEHDLYVLLYVSEATEPMNPRELQQLLGESREANRRQGITGFLLYLNGSFMQLLEGSRPRLLRLLERLREDRRHHGVRVVYEGALQQRIFTDWSMGFRDLEHLERDFDFARWRTRTLDFVDMSEDARACFNLIAAFAPTSPEQTRAAR